MGAVFAIFAGFYYWFEKMVNVQIPALAGRIHFWITFVGVNLTFFPMHFFGLAGMPRRIPDYPDAYLGWNQVASVGSYITFYGLLFFFFIVWLSFFQTNNSADESLRKSNLVYVNYSTAKNN
jgi:heme/copper-type cytochrome/quinol oxidase subunit 1